MGAYRNSEESTSRDMDQANGNTSDMTVQSQEVESTDTQLVTGSSHLNVVNSEGPVQVGDGSTTNYNPTYNYHYHQYPASPYNTNHEEYFPQLEQQEAALGASPTHPALPPCPVSQSLAGVQLQDHREEDTTDVSGQSQTHRKTAEYSMHHDNSASFHLPCHCEDCLEYHRRGHKSSAECSSPESHHLVPQLLPGPQNMEQKESTKEGEDTRDTEGRQSTTSVTPTLNQTQVTTTTTQSRGREKHNTRYRMTSVQQGDEKMQQKPETSGKRTSNPPSPSPSDVTPNVACTEQRDRRGTQTVKTGHREQKRNVESQRTEKVSRPDEPSPVYGEGIPDSDSVCIIVSRGQSLDAEWFAKSGVIYVVLRPDEPSPVYLIGSCGQSLYLGDAVWFTRDGDVNCGIYVGGKKVVWCGNKKTTGLRVRIVELLPTDTFSKATVNSCRWYREFTQEERLSRALSRVGTKFTEGDYLFCGGFDFPTWVYTGVGTVQAWFRGFELVKKKD